MTSKVPARRASLYEGRAAMEKCIDFLDFLHAEGNVEASDLVAAARRNLTDGGVYYCDNVLSFLEWLGDEDYIVRGATVEEARRWVRGRLRTANTLDSYHKRLRLYAYPLQD